MIVEGKKIKNTLIASIGGELDHHTAETVRKQLDKLLEDPTIKNIVIDVRNLNFMDSSGIGVIIGRYKKIKHRGGNMAVTNINTHIDKIFEISGLYKIIKSYSSVQDALDNIGGI